MLRLRIWYYDYINIDLYNGFIECAVQFFICVEVFWNLHSVPPRVLEIYFPFKYGFKN